MTNAFIRKNVFLLPAQWAKLTKLAKGRHISVAQLVREAVALYLKEVKV